MAEPVSQKTQKTDENPTNPDDTAPESTLPRNAEDRAAAAALSSLDADATALEGDAGTGGGDAGAAGGAKGAKGAPSAADREALGKAMNRLEALTGGKKQGQSQAPQTAAAKKLEKKDGQNVADDGAAKAKAPPVKVAGEDVNLLVEQLELSKAKATDLLKAHEGDPVKAIRAFITPSAA